MICTVQQFSEHTIIAEVIDMIDNFTMDYWHIAYWIEDFEIHSVAHNDFTKMTYHTHNEIHSSYTHSTGRSVRGEVVESLNTLAANLVARGSGLVQLLTINAGTATSSGALTETTVIRGDLEAAGANSGGTLVKRVPVTGRWGLVRQGQVGFGILDFCGLVGVLVDD